MPRLTFPTDRIVGYLDWAGAGDPGAEPFLAHGSVDVPDGVEISLRVESLKGVTPNPDGSWHVLRDDAHPVVDLEFLVDLPPASIGALVVIGHVEPASTAALHHLSVGLHELILAGTGLSDEVLPFVAQLENLTYLQTYGNHFTDRGVQQLRSLTRLEALYLEEANLTFAAFAFACELPRLQFFGVQDVPLTDPEIRQLRTQLPEAVHFG